MIKDHKPTHNLFLKKLLATTSVPQLSKPVDTIPGIRIIGWCFSIPNSAFTASPTVKSRFSKALRAVSTTVKLEIRSRGSKEVGRAVQTSFISALRKA